MARVIDRLGNYLEMEESCIDLTKYQRGWCGECFKPLNIWWGKDREFEIVCDECNREIWGDI